MRIAVVTNTSRRVGGVEEYIATILPALVSAGSEVAFWHEADAPYDRDRIPVPAGVRDICASDLGSEGAMQQLRDWRPDVLYVQGVADTALEARLLELAPSVLFLHTYIGTCISGTKTFTRPDIRPCDRTFGRTCLLYYFPRGCGGDNPLTMWRLFETQSSRLQLMGRYKAILTHSDHMRDEMHRHGVQADVVPYAVGGSSNGAPMQRDHWRLLYAGRMESLKGGHYLIDAVGEVSRAAHQRVDVVMAGDGRERVAWEARARAVEKATPAVSITFTGWVPQSRIETLIAQCDLLVVPSLWPEPFGSVGPAAARHGVPAVAFDSGGVRQWLSDGVSGHVAPANPPTPRGLAAAITRCLQDPAHLAALREGAKQMASRFTMERHVPALMQRLSAVAAR